MESYGGMSNNRIGYGREWVWNSQRKFDQRDEVYNKVYIIRKILYFRS